MKRSELKAKGKPCCGRTLCSCGKAPSLTRTPLARSPMKRVNPKRKAKEFRRAYGSVERVRWIQAQPCLICYATPSENAHTASGGAGRKADADTVVPLCEKHHRTGDDSFHNLGSARRFEERHNVDLTLAAAEYAARWRALNP